MLSYLWEWFVVPLGAPSIGILHAIGIAVLVSMLTYEGKASEEGDGIKKLFITIFAKLTAFAVAFAISFGVA